MRASGRYYKSTSIAVLALLSNTCLSFAQTEPKELPEASVVNELQTIKQSDLLKLTKPFVIDGVTRFDGWFIVADKIIFKSGSQLMFTQQALNKRRNLFIVTQELVSEDQEKPGEIYYEIPPAGVSPATPGQAPTGPHGRNDGDSGGKGADGTSGTPGPKGYSAPALTITVLKVPSSGPIINFRGGQGGQGGQGQKGGDGGNGQKGSPASQSAFGCKAGGGDGGRGGQGGTGGPGGAGGAGGDGGSVTIIAPSELLPSLSQKFRVDASGGDPGLPGAPGIGGNPGGGGPGGQNAKPYCGGGSGGSGGSPGAPGTAGPVGKPGIPGDFFVGAITPDQFKIVYK